VLIHDLAFDASSPQVRQAVLRGMRLLVKKKLFIFLKIELYVIFNSTTSMVLLYFIIFTLRLSVNDKEACLKLKLLLLGFLKE
jgi:hypothetical protein